jgi:phosphoglycolate phosphatase-like HAD superfamily hydrolase
VTGAPQDWREAEGLLFDVEGTLVDAVMATLNCWQETLRSEGLTVTLPALHAYSGMDGKQMLHELFPGLGTDARTRLTKLQGERYRGHYLPLVQGFSGVREALATLKAKGHRIALATDCQPDELDHYLDITGIRALIDAAACGSDVAQGKPAPDLVELARGRLGVRTAVMIGDTPFDARAAVQAGVAALGVETGGFDDAGLRAAGCAAVFPDIAATALAV